MSFEPRQRSVPRPSAWRNIADVVAATHALTACGDRDDLLRRALELARRRIGLERVGLYTCEPGAGAYEMHGSWGTGLGGELLDERGCRHEYSVADHDSLRRIQRGGALWLYRAEVPYVVSGAVVGHGWLAVTPIVSGDELLGVMYNDTASTYAPIDEGKQVVAAMFCGLLAGVLLAKRGLPGFVAQPPGAGQSRLVRDVLERLEREPAATGEQLARAVGVSAGYLARSFKRLVGVSLVEYRNRLRLQRFLGSVRDEDTNLLRAALEAGFGSYAQFHRVHRKLLGTSPRQQRLPGASSGRNANRSRSAKTLGGRRA